MFTITKLYYLLGPSLITYIIQTGDLHTKKRLFSGDGMSIMLIIGSKWKFILQGFDYMNMLLMV